MVAMVSTPEPAPTTRVFEVILWHKDRVEQALQALAKRGARKGLPPLVWSWGKPTTALERVPAGTPGRDPETHKATITRIPLTLACKPPQYGGWTFAAALQHVDGENVTRTVPGREIPKEYRTRGAKCDHCRMDRRRADTYVLVHEDGRHVQVGSTCLGDFLGVDDAGKLADQASWLAGAAGIAEDGESDFSGGSFRRDYTLGEFLPFVAWEIRVNGWVSRTAARERAERSPMDPGCATADAAWSYLMRPEKRAKAPNGPAEPTDEDLAEAAAAEAWAEALTDAEIDAAKGDYLHNLRVIARTGLSNDRTGGLSASMVVAYQRAIGRERLRAERAARPKADAYVGEVGKRQGFGECLLDFVTGFETAYGYTTIVKLRTADGALLVWKASSTEITRADVGKRYVVKGTVKKHEEYKGEKQTIVSRCALDPVEEIDDEGAAS